MKQKQRALRGNFGGWARFYQILRGFFFRMGLYRWLIKTTFLNHILLHQFNVRLENEIQFFPQ